MRKLGICIIATVCIMSCEDNEHKNSFNKSDLIGRWEFDHQKRDGVLQTVYPDQHCKYDQVYEFHEDGTVTANDPCQWNDLVESKANWRMEDDKLFIDYYVIPGLSVNPVVVSLTKEALVLQQMYGDVVVVQNVFRKTTKDALDYASDAEGTYSGWMNYSRYYISNTFRGDSIPAEITVKKDDWGNLSVEYRQINVLGTIRNVKVDNIQTTRYLDERRFALSATFGSNMLFIKPDSIYNIRSSGSLGVFERDSIHFALNFSKIELQDPDNISSPSVENFYQYQRFHGIKKK